MIKRILYEIKKRNKELADGIERAARIEEIEQFKKDMERLFKDARKGGS